MMGNNRRSPEGVESLIRTLGRDRSAIGKVLMEVRPGQLSRDNMVEQLKAAGLGRDRAEAVADTVRDSAKAIQKAILDIDELLIEQTSALRAALTAAER